MVEKNSEHEKAKGADRNVVAAISHNEYKDVSLNNKCMRHSMNRIQRKGHRIGNYEINKISLLVASMTKYISKIIEVID